MQRQKIGKKIAKSAYESQIVANILAEKKETPISSSRY